MDQLAVELDEEGELQYAHSVNSFSSSEVTMTRMSG